MTSHIVLGLLFILLKKMNLLIFERYRTIYNLFRNPLIVYYKIIKKVFSTVIWIKDSWFSLTFCLNYAPVLSI